MSEVVKHVSVCSSLNELRRDLQNVLGAKANINLGPTIENYAGETFLSQEVAINIMQETKLAFKRCQVVSSPSLTFAHLTLLIC